MKIKVTAKTLTEFDMEVPDDFSDTEIEDLVFIETSNMFLRVDSIDTEWDEDEDS